MKKSIFTFIGIFFSFLSVAQNDLDIDYQLRGHIYASSSVADTAALGGFGSSDNIPKSLINEDFAEKGFFLKIDTLSKTTIAKKFNGYKLLMVNKSNSIIKLTASDSRLSVIAQAFIDQKWQDIEYLPSSSCGNSYHIVSLMPNEYWTFDVPKFSGKIKTKLRYRLSFGRNEEEYLYSNEILTSVNKKQLKIKQGHNPDGLMDPYND